MTRTLAPLAAVAAATPAFAHESGGIAHVHPHGTETLLALLVLVSLVIWGLRARR